MAATLLVALLLVTGIQVTIQQTCHSRDLTNCIQGLAEYANNNDVAFPTNKEELDKQCEILKNVRECTYNYSLKCISELSRTIGNIIVMSTAENMKDFCTEGNELNTKFLANAICIRDNYAGVTPCVKTGLAALETLPNRNWRERLPAFCCALGQLLSCLQDHFLKACNQDTADLVSTMLEFGITDVVVEACSMIEKSEKCPDLPPPGTELDGSYKNNFFGELISAFIRE